MILKLHAGVELSLGENLEKKNNFLQKKKKEIKPISYNLINCSGFPFFKCFALRKPKQRER